MNRPGVQGHGAPARTVGAAIAALHPPARRAHATGRSAGLAQASTRHPPGSSPGERAHRSGCPRGRRARLGARARSLTAHPA